MENEFCLECGYEDHLIRDCLFRRIGNAAPVRPALSAQQSMTNKGPTRGGAPLPLQQHAFDQAQRGARAGVGHGISQAYNLITEEARASDEIEAGCDARYLKQEL